MQTIVRMWLYVFLMLPIIALAQSGSGSNVAVSTRNPGQRWYAYVSLDSEQCIAVYTVNPDNGRLSLSKKVSVDGTPGSLGLDPSGRTLYAAIRSTQRIAAFRVNQQSGDLSPLKSVQAAGNPVYVGTDRTGRFLLTAYFSDSKAAIYSINEDGSLKDSAVQVLATEKNAHAIQTDPTNHFVFVPCRTGEAIQLHRFDPLTGRLTPNSPDRFTTPTNTGPRHFAFHPRMPLVYFVNEFNSTVTVYRLDAAGTLTAIQTISALPSEFTGTSTGADVHLTPDALHLYASNRGHESIAAFAVDGKTGLLTSLGTVATEKTPRSFAIDPTGLYLYAAGQGSGSIAAYRIERNSGRLERFATYDAGRNPVWILVTALSAK
jgi:6-phosphogluconolactonase